LLTGADLVYALPMKRFGLAASAVVLVALAAGVSSATACVTAPTTIPNDRLLTSDDTHLTVAAHTVVWVVLVEAEGFTSHPGFPWTPPTSSDRVVLLPLRVCRRTRVSTLPDKVYAFDARRPGRATVVASLAKGWGGSINPRPRAVRDTVTVR
jgi:hypothetical protein